MTTREDQLLAAARTVFAERGYHAAGVSDIVSAAGVARGTFYNYFESKRAIFGAVLQSLMDEAEGVVVPIDVMGDIPDQVRENLRRIVAAVTVDEVTRLLFAESVGVDAQADAAIADFYGRAVERIERALLRGQRMGIVRAGDMGLTARMLLGAVHMPALMAVLEGEPLQAAALVEELEAMLRGGVLSGV